MPKVKPLGSMDMKRAQLVTNAVRKRSPTDDEKVRRQLRRLKYESGKTHAEIAAMLCIGPRTWTSHIQYPERIRLEEQRRIQELGKLFDMDIQFT